LMHRAIFADSLWVMITADIPVETSTEAKIGINSPC
jgi:hypothetical protein